MTIGEYVFNFIINTFFGGSYDNLWLTENLDKIQGIMTVCISVLIFFVALSLVWGIWRALQRAFHFWD